MLRFYGKSQSLQTVYLKAVHRLIFLLGCQTGDYIIENVRRTSNSLIVQSDYSIMQKNVKYILFLKKSPGYEYYSIIGGNQGKFNIDDSDNKEKEKENKIEQFNSLKKSVLSLYSSKI